MLDLEPVTRTLTRVLEGVRDDQLTAETPCPGQPVGTLIQHLDGVGEGFGAAARKDLEGGSQAPEPDAAKLPADWRTSIPEKLVALAEAWRDPGAWSGMTRVGGIDLPGEVAGVFALDELVVHGWDIAMATGQSFEVDPQLGEALHGFLRQAVVPEGTPGLFGPPVPVPDDAPLLDRVLGLTGRSPEWKPTLTHA